MTEGKHEADGPLEAAVGRVFTPKVRAYLYGVAGSVTPLLVTVGALRNDVAGHVLAIAGAVLALGSSGLALANLERR